MSPGESVFSFARFKRDHLEALARVEPPAEPVLPTIVGITIEWVDQIGRRLKAPLQVDPLPLLAAGCVVRVDIAETPRHRRSGWFLTGENGAARPCHPASLDIHEREAFDEIAPRSAAGRVTQWHDFAGATMRKRDLRFHSVDELHRLEHAFSDPIARPTWVLAAGMTTDGRPGGRIDEEAARWAMAVEVLPCPVAPTLGEAIDRFRRSLLCDLRQPETDVIRLRSWDGDDDFLDLEFVVEPITDGVEPHPIPIRMPTAEERREQGAAYARKHVEHWCAVVEKAALAIAVRRVVDPLETAEERERVLGGLQAYRLINSPGDPFVASIEIHPAVSGPAG